MDDAVVGVWLFVCLLCFLLLLFFSHLNFSVALCNFLWQENFGLGGYAVAYAGSQFAAVSVPQFLANSSYHITSLSLVLDFDTGRLKTPLWKSDGCKACQGNSSFVCVHGECAIPSKYCKGSGGTEDCSLSIQLTWSGTDQRYQVLNSWYQINNLGQYSLYNLYSNLMSSLSNQYNSYFH